jgi:prolipoprotein diacylglyceryltransferase
MKNIFDLRFIIGLFFLLVGIFLFITSFVSHPIAGKTETVNFWCGIVYIVFGIFMLILWKVGGNNEPVGIEEE